MVNAFSVTNGVVMGQLKTDAKSNEIPELLALLNIKGTQVTIDAMGTQADIAHTIRCRLPVSRKGNQSALHQRVKRPLPFSQRMSKTPLKSRRSMAEKNIGNTKL